MNVYELMEEILNTLDEGNANVQAYKDKLHADFRLADKKARHYGKVFNKYYKDHDGYIEGDEDCYADMMTSHNERKEALNKYKKVAGNSTVKEAFELMEEILFELDSEQKQNISPNKIKKAKKDENGEKVEVVSVADELFPYEGDAKQQFNQKILAKINDMIEGVGSLEDLIQFVRRGVQAKKVAHESIQEGKPKDPKGYKENMDIANHYDHLYSNEPAKAPDGSPNSVAAEWNRRYQHYFDKAMKCYYGDGEKSKKVAEALSAIKEVADTILERKNIFGHEEGNRGDLIDDVSKTVTGSTLHQHIENAANKVAKPVKTEDKIKKVGEAFELMEEIINEVSAGYVKKKAEAVIDKRKAEADHAYNFARKVYNYEVNKTGDSKNTPMTDKADNQSYEKGGRWSHAYLLSKHLPDSKKSIKPMVQAAKKVADTRSNHHWNDVEPTGTQEEIKKTYNRAEKAGTLARTDKKFKSDEASGY